MHTACLTTWCLLDVISSSRSTRWWTRNNNWKGGWNRRTKKKLYRKCGCRGLTKVLLILDADGPVAVALEAGSALLEAHGSLDARAGVDFMKMFWPKFMDVTELGQIEVCNCDIRRLQNTLKSSITVHNTQVNMYFLFLGEDLVRHFKIKILSENFSSEMEFHKIDPWTWTSTGTATRTWPGSRTFRGRRAGRSSCRPAPDAGGSPATLRRYRVSGTRRSSHLQCNRLHQFFSLYIRVTRLGNFPRGQVHKQSINRPLIADPIILI
jgi:hypothetical protein